MSNQNNITVSEDNETIFNYFKNKSTVLTNYINKRKGSEYTLIEKRISYADVLSMAKRKDKSESFDKDILIYLTSKELIKLSESETNEFGITKQSNITMPQIFYEKLKVPQLQRREGKQKDKHDHVLINDYAEVYLVNESLDYFRHEWTEKVFKRLNKLSNWKEIDMDVDYEEGDFTKIELRHAIHGIGTSKDKEFHKLRHNLFRNDIMACLIENNNDKRNLFIFLEKNPIFFTICGLMNEKWGNYVKKEINISTSKLKYEGVNLYEEEAKTRRYQSEWRKMLASEAMNYTTHDGEVFCAFTNIRTDYNSLGPLFRASHIKRYEKCSSDEAYDINNGLLLCANADALFDKFLITVDENKELKFSFLLDNDPMLKQQLQLNQQPFQLLLNDKRMEYMKWHRNEFEEKEKKRKTNPLINI